ncbi:Ectoine dioxygenase [Aquicella siphonis]|uniref:Ectoine dioxygenase n=1 Tax=Aquicella siphonis TaxID=254247 RepID=A0A5E4PJ76_9COXI|nr:phytanoyl-CoA dioxygenase family protein [Aquicella siphonis]VVC76487.1 Ectoine dioxygenase [Aquicella siphonis]
MIERNMQVFDTSRYSFLSDPQKALDDYFELGYHIEPAVYSDEECADLIKAGHELEDAKNDIFRPCMMPHRQNPLYIKAMKKPLIVEIISAMVGGQAAGLQSEFFYCKPGTRGFSLHQDNFYVEAEYGVFASAWAALTDTYYEKGGLIIYPESHKEGALPVRKLNLGSDSAQDPNANNEETVVPPHYSAYNVAIPKGAVLFIHGHLVHGSNPNQTSEWRHVLLNTYIKSGEKFRAGFYAKREEVPLAD